MRKKLLLGLSAFVCAASLASAKPLIVGHRGASANAPENTTVSMQLAWDLNADGAEFDIWSVAPKKMIVIHDDSTSRTAQGYQKLIHREPLENLRKIDVGSWRGRWFAKTYPPTIEEVFAIHPKGKIYVIELKNRRNELRPDFIPDIKAAIEKTGRPLDEFIIISFSWDACVTARKEMPGIQVYFLTSPKTDEKGKKIPYDESLLKRVKDANLTGVNVAFDGVQGPEIVKKAHEMGLKFLVWTVNDPADIKRLAGYGVDAITTDRVDLARRIVDNM